MSHEEKIGNSSYTRPSKEERKKIVGKRIVSPERFKGKITHTTVAKGEQHPSIFHVEGSEENPTAHEVLNGFVEFDGRHGFLDI